MSILMMCNLKGGVAKTTSAVAIAECLANQGHRTLLIDADHQCMAGELLLGELGQLKIEHARRTLHDLLAAMLDEDFVVDHFSKYVVEKVSDIGGGLTNLSALPCSIRIDAFSTNMAKAKRGHQSNDEFLRVLNRRRNQMRRWLETNYDYTIIDCPPSMAIQVQMLFPVADSFVIPCIPDRLSVRGSLYLLDRVLARGYKTPALGTLWSLFREQNPMHARVMKWVANRSEIYAKLPPPFKAVIPNAAQIAEATEEGRRYGTLRKKYGAFARLFEQLCDEIRQRCKAQQLQQTAGNQPAEGAAVG